jgi:DNA gyrase/topoisomerase IV subunit A
MGKKSRRNNTNKKEPIRKGHSAAAVRTRVSDTVLRLFNANKHDEILDIKSNYGHFDPFCNNPVKSVYVIYAFGIANISRSQEKDNCLDRAIHSFERAIKLVNSIQDEEFQDGQAQIMKTTIDMTVAASYAEQGRDIEKSNLYAQMVPCKQQP